MEKVGAGAVGVLWITEAAGIHCSADAGIEGATLVAPPGGHPSEELDDPETEEYELDVGAVFLAIGHTPNTGYLEDTDVELDEAGYIRTKGGRGAGQTETDVPGIFGAGDVVDLHYQQAVTAGGMGVEAALDADDYLDDLDRGVVPAAESAAAETDD
jgi:thioredoxin reductase (NADPH)